MKNLGKLALLGAVIAASAQFASAATLSGDLGTINIYGATDNGSVPNSSFVLSSVGSFTLPAGGDPTLSDYSIGDAIYTFTAKNGVITSTGPSAGTGGELFSGSSLTPGNLGTIEFIGQTYTFTTGADPDPAGQYEFVINGYFTGTGVTGQVAGTDTFNFNVLSKSNNEVTENFAVAAAPEPNSLMLLGTGLLSGAGMLIRKRRTA